MKNSYHNTNQEAGKELISSENKAKTQEEIILSIFKDKKKLSASEAYFLFPKSLVPLTSIRRAITNLSNQKLLLKTSEMKKGIYGKKEHIYIKI